MLEYIKGAEVLGTVNEKRCLMAYSIGIQNVEQFMAGECNRNNLSTGYLENRKYQDEF